MQISADERKRVEDAIRTAEAKSGADFVCVLLRNSSTYEFYPLAWASLLALATPWLLLWVTPWPFVDLLLAQTAVFGVALLLFSTPGLRRFLVPRQLQRATAHRAAAEQFLIRDLATAPARRGVLLFVSHDEHYARILADEGALQAVPAEHWRGAVDRLVAEVRRGRHAAGFVAALEHCAEALQAGPQQVPAPDRARALPDRFFVQG